MKRLDGLPAERHGASRDGRWTVEYIAWRSMRARCTQPRRRDYPAYGGRGIRVCDRWASFAAFLTDMGPRPEGHSLDRIDVNGHYTPENCRWATATLQAHNRRTNVLTEDLVKWIKGQLAAGLKQVTIAKILGFDTRLVGKVARGERWADVTP